MKKIVVLSGAGVSAESGIATFRDSNGLWEGHRVEDVATPEGWRRNLGGIAFATVAAGFLGGIGFAAGELLKLVGISSGLVTNWHSVMEQTQGLFHGIAIAIPMGLLIAHAPPRSDDPPVRKWTEVFSVSFVMVLLTYLTAGTLPDIVQYVPELTPEKLKEIDAGLAKIK